MAIGILVWTRSKFRTRGRYFRGFTTRAPPRRAGGSPPPGPRPSRSSKAPGSTAGQPGFRRHDQIRRTVSAVVAKRAATASGGSRPLTFTISTMARRDGSGTDGFHRHQHVVAVRAFLLRDLYPNGDAARAKPTSQGQAAFFPVKHASSSPKITSSRCPPGGGLGASDGVVGEGHALASGSVGIGGCQQRCQQIRWMPTVSHERRWTPKPRKSGLFLVILPLMGACGGGNGAQGRNRTTDTRIFNPLLYQLSYLGVRTGGRPNWPPHAEARRL